jgi:hypothetical protein
VIETKSISGRYPSAHRGKIIVWGMMATLPFGGMLWQVYHYLVGLRRLGFDVWYVEDSDRSVYDPIHQNPTMECSGNLALLAQFMSLIGLKDRWVFRAPGTTDCFGAMDWTGLKSLYGEVEAAINLCGCQEPRQEHLDIGCRIYLETDPVENQVAVALGHKELIDRLDAYNFHFTYGENFGSPDCLVPLARYEWRTTRPPVIIDLWSEARLPPPGAALTTIAKLNHKSTDIGWKGYGSKDVRWNGSVWRWSKNYELLKYIHVPLRSKLPVEISTGALSRESCQILQSNAWRIRDAALLNDPLAYREYIQTSLGEFTVAKEQYVAPRTGWFSDRSVCYLAARRPVIMQDTGFSKRIPVGAGLFAFSSYTEVEAAIDAIARNYALHSTAALEVAQEYFDADKVIRRMFSTVGLIA